MRFLAIATLFCGLAATGGGVLAAQENPAVAHGTAPGEEEHGKTLGWMWANFIVLAGALGYLIHKNAGPFYAGRSRKIRKDLIESADLRKDAERRAAEIESRLANLEHEIAALREESEKEAGAETERLTAQATADVAKIQAGAEQEIEAAGRAARLELKRFAASIALDLAERKIRSRMTGDLDEKLVGNFVRKLEQPAPAAHGV
jgi:F0F1-type ATP synthase membrane subunit b/b'